MKRLQLVPRTDNPDSFHGFLQAALSAFLAFVFTLRLFIFTGKRRIVQPPVDVEDSEEPTTSTMADSPPRGHTSSVMGLLQTDEMPTSCSDEEASTSSTPLPLPSLLQSNLPTYLHTINEEESDDVRSASSLASPRTVVDRRLSDLLSQLSPTGDISEDPYDSEVDTETATADTSLLPERPSTSSVHVEELNDDTFDLLKELAKIGKNSQMSTATSEEVKHEEMESANDSVASLEPPEELAPAPPPHHVVPVLVPLSPQPEQSDVSDEHKEHESEGSHRDADREQDEELVFNDERRKTVTMDHSTSLQSTSISLDTTREELHVNDSNTSNPIDESTFMQSTKDGTERPRSPLDLPPPPVSLGLPPPPPPPPPAPVGVLQTTAWSPTESRSPSTLHAAQPPPSILSSRAPIASPYSYFNSTGMSVPTEAPPPPPPPPAFAMPSSYKSVHSSREDLLSEHATSRSTVREIPVQRAPSTAPSHSSVFEYNRMPSTYHPVETPSDEYYRREVMTRTVITRSTEALSQPPLGRSSPIERYYPYNDGRTREEKTVDYKVTYHHDIEEEERRVREDQDRRRLEEEERRRREDEGRRQWELMERETLQRLRDQQTLNERQLERSLLERERLEKERIEKDRNERKRQEMLRRKEWERIENERIALEEADLARKRLLEKDRLEREKAEEERRMREQLEKERERLERERIEMERRERERQERERIERERIERERIEIERIERIKRERIEREKKDREKEKEEEERLKREREELERIEHERREIEMREREALEQKRREGEEHERQRLEDEAREVRRREEERREAELLLKVQRQAEEREMLRRRKEREEQERLERIRREQQRVDMERADAERRERERMEEERREKELLDASQRNKDLRERERLEDIERERLLQEEERRERERRELERRAAADRERQRRMEEEKERARLAELERTAAVRRAQRDAELDRERQREELDRQARQISEMERLENERRERERLEEEQTMLKLREQEKRNKDIRDRERREAAEREETRRLEDRRSRDKLDLLVRERTEKEKFESEKRHLIAEKEAMNKKKHHLLSSETLQKLTQPAYYSREPAEVTTKVERQVIERIGRNLWVEDVPVGYPSTQNAISYSLDSTNDENARDRIFNPNDLNRNGSSRSRYHRAKMDKARRDFYSSTQDSTDAVGDRFRKSTDDISMRGRPDYRGPLLQRFHDAGFRSNLDSDNLPYRRVAPSPYSQEFERLLEEAERKYAAYRHRMSQPSLYSTNRDWATNLDDPVNDGKVGTSAYPRAESVVAYEREIHRESPSEVAHIRSRSADYLMDRKIREETEVPENQLQKSAADPSPRESRMSEHEIRFHKSTEKLTVPDWYRERNTPNTTTTYRPYPSTATHNETTDGGIEFPRGMFDKYRNEIEDMRRSRSSLHQLGAEQHRQGSQLSVAEQARALPGYTVSEVPNEWNVQHSSYPMADDVYQGNVDGPGIYTNNYSVMHQIIKQPERAEHLLRDEDLYVRCSQCHRTRELADARLQFVSCKHCYTYYCSRECRQNNWVHHAARCSFARINTLCKDVIMKVREDEEAQAFMSKVAREGFAGNGRGSVNIRLNSPQLAQAYVNHGWRTLSHTPLNQLLYYYTVAALVQEKKEPSLIALCRRYEPREKFILSVSIIADIERCPETPQPETRELASLSSAQLGRLVLPMLSAVPSNV